MRSVWLWIWCGVVTSVWWPADAVVGGNPASPPEPDAAVVFVQKYGRSCRVEGIKDQKLGYYTFFGIRYAEPPVGPRRFQRPVRRILAGELTASKPCSACPQPRLMNIFGREDCLCLNVFSPKMPGEEKGSPVIFFIHGGNYRTGSAHPYGGKHLVQADTIVVVAQYRLGSLGFITNGQKDASGNAGMFDLHAAMSWVKDYIQFFGGDPSNVIIMGQGSGASAASVLSLSPEDRSSKGVAALSGAPLSPGAVRSNPEKYAEELATRTNCPSKPVERLALCLRALPVEKIIQADKDSNVDFTTQNFLDEVAGRAGTGARVEGSDDNRALPILIEEMPATSLKKKRQHAPLLTGVTSAETSRAVFGKYSNFLKKQLQEVSDFIKKDIIGGLQNVVTDVEGLLISSLKLDQVQKVFPLGDFYQSYTALRNESVENTITTVDALTKIVEATGDALFNFPAYQSVKEWATGAPSYLYSFEFVGNLTKGSHFLPGVILADNNEESEEAKKSTIKGPAHGDELAYLFEPLDEEGNSIEKDEISSTDAHVRKSFVGMVAEFAHSLNPLGTKKESKFSNLLLPFSKDNDQYIKIDNDISLGKNFRYCQMGLWGNMADRTSGELCKKLFDGLLKFPTSLLKPVTGNGGVPNLFNPVDTQAPLVSLVPRPPRPSKNNNNSPSVFNIPFRGLQ
ncbi:carboxylesterase 5A [Achroia grisella]|uniref:carboxylesterase 5A n=1 Tax=Achroia grisella TaxID=688607 RepID=UPI0027D1F14C|nr:carboxylesterase 5A [Achroia grisella]